MPDVAKTARDVVVVADEVQARTIDADDAVASCGKAAAIASDSVTHESERRAVTGRKDHGVERPFDTIKKADARSREFRQARGQLDASSLDRIRQVKSNQRNSRTALCCPRCIPRCHI